MPHILDINGVLVTRPINTRNHLVNKLTGCGFNVYCRPGININFVNSSIVESDVYIWLSKLAVRGFFRNENAEKALKHKIHFASGPETQRELLKYKIVAMFPESQFSSESLIDTKEFKSIPKESSICICTGTSSLDIVYNYLISQGYKVSKYIGYESSINSHLSKLHDKFLPKYILSSSLNCLKSTYEYLNTTYQSYTQNLTFIVASQRMVEYLKTTSFVGKIHCSKDATDISMINSLIYASNKTVL